MSKPGDYVSKGFAVIQKVITVMLPCASPLVVALPGMAKEKASPREITGKVDSKSGPLWRVS